jgi:Anti-sigma-K factor rskA
MSRDFDELVGNDLTPAERERLRGVHEMLVAAGPPPELPPSLEQPPSPRAKSEIPYFPRRRWAAAALAAAAIVVAAFGGGYLVGHNGGESFAARAVVVMRATPAAPEEARGTLKLGSKDEAGNWPMLVNVAGLRELPEGGYYNLYLTKKGRPVVLCGSFVVQGERTSLRYTEPYTLAHFDGWVVTLQKKGHHQPGPVVLRT